MEGHRRQSEHHKPLRDAQFELQVNGPKDGDRHADRDRHRAHRRRDTRSLPRAAQSLQLAAEGRQTRR